MKVNIHLNTVKNYYEKKFNKKVEGKIFANDITGETYCLFFEKGTNISLLALKDDKDVVCMDSNGEAVSTEKLYGYINHVYAYGEYAGMIFDAEKLNLNYKGQPINIAELTDYEKKMCPERTNIVLNAVFMRKASLPTVTDGFYVDEVIYVSNDEFKKISSGQDSEILADYNNRNYERVADGRNGVLIVADNGDGLMVDTQGYNYARYMSYAPHIKDYIDTVVENEMVQKATLEMKLYVPLTVTEYDEESDDEIAIDGSQYSKEIREKIREENRLDGNRGLAKYFWSDDKCRNKVYSIKPDVEFVNDMIMGVAVIKITNPLSNEELDSLKDYVTGQFSDGWGESFEQHEIQTYGGEIYIHFWNSEDYYIKTEDELSAPEQQSGMQGMSM